MPLRWMHAPRIWIACGWIGCSWLAAGLRVDGGFVSWLDCYWVGVLDAWQMWVDWRPEDCASNWMARIAAVLASTLLLSYRLVVPTIQCVANIDVAPRKPRMQVARIEMVLAVVDAVSLDIVGWSGCLNQSWNACIQLWVRGCTRVACHACVSPQA